MWVTRAGREGELSMSCAATLGIHRGLIADAIDAMTLLLEVIAWGNMPTNIVNHLHGR